MGDMVIALVFEENNDSIALGEIIDRAKKVGNDIPGVKMMLTRGDAAETIKFFVDNGELPVDQDVPALPKVGRFRRKPTEVQAVQLSWATWNDVCELVGDAIGEHNPAYYISPDDVSDTCGETGEYIGLNLKTMHGEIAVFRHGDWIIPDAKPGTFYPCNPTVFKNTYEPVEET